MGKPERVGRSLAPAAAFLAAVGLVAACATGPALSPAPVFLRGDDPGLSPHSAAISYRSPAPVYLHGADGGLAPGSMAAPYRATAPVTAEIAPRPHEPEQRIIARPIE